MSFLGSLKKAVTNVGKTVKKAVVDTGHAVGTAVTSKVGQAVLGGALAVTGFGLPVAAAVGAGVKATGNLIKPGGNLGKAATGAYQGAALGVGSAVVGSGVRAVVQGKGLGGFTKMLVGGRGAANKPATAEETIVHDAIIEPAEQAPPVVTSSGITKMPEPIALPVKNAKGDLKPRMTEGTPTDTHKPRQPRNFGSLINKAMEKKMEAIGPIGSTSVPAASAPEIQGGAGGAGPVPAPSVEGSNKNLMLYAAAAAAVVLVVVLASSGRKAA